MMKIYFKVEANIKYYEILLRKLHKYGVRGKADLDWFTTFLANRTQYVKLGNVESNFLQIVCGVPQGSTLR